MILSAARDGRLVWEGHAVRCALGKGGVVAVQDKREGDGASPAGVWPLRQVLYRPDRVDPPRSLLPVGALGPDDGWCDDPAHPDYNRAVKLPHPARCETLWRADGLYDVVVPLGYNDEVVRPGAGSAIFLHCASPEFAPTEGCVAVAREVLVEMLAACRPGDVLAVT